MTSTITHSAGGSMFAGTAAVNVFALITLKGALKLYDATGMKPNRAYTPTNMLAAAGKATGKTYKRGQFKQAIADLEAVIATARAAIPETTIN